MKILVCFQITNEFESLTFGEWNDIADGRDVLSYARKVIDKVDEAGIETALRLQDVCAEADEGFAVDAITVANSLPRGFATMIYAAGVRSVILMKTEPEQHGGAAYAAEKICEFVRQEEYDMIIAGCRSSRNEGARTGTLISEILGWEMFANVRGIALDSENGLTAECRMGTGFAKCRLSTPAICTMDDSYPVFLRIPTLRQQLRVKEKEILTETIMSNAAHSHDPVLVSQSAVDRRRNCTMLDIESQEDMQKLYQLIAKGLDNR